ncbi:serine/threonine-protein kinase [Symbioplanes lichenis]|uniref:serine/threonine-protein kinase n=1 Tax=Symbioplanes lichenis TaxID=1629072 RepID=UPI0027382041|nr:serine/threonine-protein kinase [Actinoplanes lichenis]
MTAGPVEVAGRYRLGETLGAGGMGRVWVARDEILQRDVAVKEILLPPDLVEGERDSVHRRTVQEARAAAQLSHPNVAQVYDVIEDDGRAWIVMEYVPSRSLQEAIRDDGPLDPHDVAVLGLEVLDALEAAHRAGVRHRDVKPANVLLGDDGRVVLTDFGIASIEGDSVITTSHEPVLGSPSYMSPERAKDGKALEASDLWSLGATLYAAVEGRPPYKRANAMATLTALATEEPDPATRAGVLQPVLDGLLVKDPAQRIGAAETRRRLLDAASPAASSGAGTPPAAAAGTPPAAAAGTPPAAAGSRPHRLRRRYAVTGATLAALLAGGVAVWATRPDERRVVSPPPPVSAPSQASTPSVTPSAAPSSAAPSAAPSSAAPSSAAPSSPAATSRAPSSPAAGALPPKPAGWRDWTDPTGFKVYVPAGWKHSIDEDGMVYFRGDGRTIGIDQTTKPQWDPVADWEGKRDARRAAGDFPGYKEIHIKEVTYFRKAADWEFTFNGSASRRHVNNRGVVTSNHQAYGFWFETADSDWSDARADLQLIFASFRPKP